MVGTMLETFDARAKSFTERKNKTVFTTEKKIKSFRQTELECVKKERKSKKKKKELSGRLNLNEVWTRISKN